MNNAYLHCSCGTVALIVLFCVIIKTIRVTSSAASLQWTTWHIFGACTCIHCNRHWGRLCVSCGRTYIRVHEIAHGGPSEKNTNLVSVLSKIHLTCDGHVWQDWWLSRTLIYVQMGHSLTTFTIVTVKTAIVSH